MPVDQNQSRPVLEVLQLLNKLGDTLRFFEKQFRRHEQELLQSPKLSDFWQSVPEQWRADLEPDFLEFANALHKFSSRINQVQRIGMKRYHLTSYSELDLQERQRITQINSRLNEMEVIVKQRLDEIDAQMRSQSKDAEPPLCDREYIVHVQASLRHTDPAYCDECDNCVAEFEILPHEQAPASFELYRLKEGWPQGYEFDGMPHDEFMHQLRYYGAPNMKPVDLRDILRIGRIDLDIVTYHQFSYDLDKGQWLTEWPTEDAPTDSL